MDEAAAIELGDVDRHGVPQGVPMVSLPARHSALYDGWRQFGAERQGRLRRFTLGKHGATIDNVAKALGPDVTVDDAWSWWAARCALPRSMRVRESAEMVRRRSEPDNADILAGRFLVDRRELVGPIEVADRLGVERQTVHQWRYRHLLPEPAATISGVPVWEWPAIDAWARETGRYGAELAGGIGDAVADASSF